MDSYTRSTHTFGNPQLSLLFHRESRVEKDCRFFRVTQSINLLFIIRLLSTDEGRGWRMGGGNVFTVAMTRSVGFMLFIIFLSFHFSSVLCSKSAFLCLLTQFCLAGIDPEFNTLLEAINVFFCGCFPLSERRSAPGHTV